MNDLATSPAARASVASAAKEWLKNALKGDLAQRVAGAVNFDLEYWQRYSSYEQCDAWLRELNPGMLDAMEISGSGHFSGFGWRSFDDRQYPAFDICQHQIAPESVDLVIADQVFEHLAYPYRAARNIHAGLRPGGHFLVLVPFLIRVHRIPTDCTRWTEDGLRYFLVEAGFTPSEIRTGSWGNRACVKANLVRNYWARRGWGSVKNDPTFPVNVWALARKV
jgi:SAM-dependent methyltransferase